jgi:hypothetical protein
MLNSLSTGTTLPYLYTDNTSKERQIRYLAGLFIKILNNFLSTHYWHSPPSTAKVKRGGAITSLAHVFMA